MFDKQEITESRAVLEHTIREKFVSFVQDMNEWVKPNAHLDFSISNAYYNNRHHTITYQPDERYQVSRSEETFDRFTSKERVEVVYSLKVAGVELKDEENAILAKRIYERFVEFGKLAVLNQQNRTLAAALNTSEPKGQVSQEPFVFPKPSASKKRGWFKS